MEAIPPSMNAWWMNRAIWEHGFLPCERVVRITEIAAFHALSWKAQRERPALVRFCVKLERWLLEHEKMLDTNRRLDEIGKWIGVRERYQVKIILDEAELYAEECG